MTDRTVVGEKPAEKPVEADAPQVEPKEDPVQKASDELETIQPSAKERRPREWKIGQDDQERTYVQKPLSYITRGRLFALFASNLRQAMLTGGEGALSDLFQGGDIASRARELSSADSQSAESFISLMSSVTMYAPDFLVDAYTLILGVPAADRDVFEYLIELGEDEGGLSDADHTEIQRTFIRQNWKAIRDFFSKDLPSLAKEVRDQQETKEKEDGQKSDT